MFSAAINYRISPGKILAPPFLKLTLPLTLCILAFTCSISLAQKTSKDDYTGDWNDNNSWTGGTSPATANIGNADLDLNIYGYISRINGDQNLSFANVNADATGPNLIIHDTLVVYGNMTLANKAANLVIQSGAVLIVLGDFSATNIISVENGGIFVVAGTMSFNSSGQDDYSGAGDLYAGNVMGNPNASNADQGLLELGTDYPEIYEFVINNGIYPLPVEVLYFAADVLDNRVKLEWETILEERFDFFTIEKSVTGISFLDYARISTPKAQSTSVKHYEFMDEMPFPGTSYYRLKSNDLDGNIEYHGVLMVNLEGIHPEIFIFPNPLTDHTLNASFSGSEEKNFKILNTAGRIIDSGTVFPGRNVIPLNPALPPGFYILQMEGGYRSGKLIIK